MRGTAILTSLAVASAAVPSAVADPPREGPIGPAKAPPPPPPRYGPIGPAVNEGPQGVYATPLTGFSFEGDLVYMVYDSDLRLQNDFGGRARVYFPVVDPFEAALGFTIGTSRDRAGHDHITTLDFHAGAFVRERWDLRSGDQIELYGGVLGGTFRLEDATPSDAAPFGALEGGIRWRPEPHLGFGVGYEFMFTSSDANRQGAGSATILNHYLTASILYEF